jgi:hypothetical protein
VFNKTETKHKKKKLLAYTMGWLMVAGLSFAAWNGSATGTLAVTTTNPASGTLEYVPGETITFSNDGQSDTFRIRVTLPAGSSGTYDEFTTVASSSTAQGGCPAGAITVAGGQLRSFTTELEAGQTQTHTSTLTANIGPGAPAACANQSINLPLSVVLNPV